MLWNKLRQPGLSINLIYPCEVLRCASKAARHSFTLAYEILRNLFCAAVRYTKYGLPSARFLSRNWYAGSSAGAFLRYVQTIWYSVFRRCGDPRFVVGVLCVSCLPDWSTAGSTPAKPTMELRRGKRRTSPISAMSCAAVVSPTPYMACTVSYSGSCEASRVISARRAASVVLPARSCCAAVTMSSLVLSFFGSVVKCPQLLA